MNLATAEWDDEPQYDDNGRQTYPPLYPFRLDYSLAVDVSPMRPDEWANQKMMPWQRAALDQDIYNDTVAEIQGEAQSTPTGGGG